MAELMKSLAKGTPWYIRIMVIIFVILAIVGFILPPMGVIDSSVWQTAAVLIGLATLAEFVCNLPAIINSGTKARINVGGENGVKVEVEGKDEKGEENFEG